MSAATHEKAVPRSDRVLTDLRVYAHSSLLFWWPVWAVALLMALGTYLDNYQMVLVPPNATVEAARAVAPAGEAIVDPLVHVARSKLPGVIFVATLLAVIVFSHLWARGPWALFFVIRVGGANPQFVELRNVVRVGKRLALMEERLRTKDVV